MKELINFLLEAQILSRTQKSGIKYLRGPISDTISSHSYLTTLIGWILAHLEKVDESKVIKICLLHDLAESRTEDLNVMDQFYLQQDEKRIFEEIFEELPINFLTEFKTLIEEFLASQTPEALLAKDATKLAWMVITKECLAMGNKEAAKWLRFSLAQLQTESGKQMGKKLIEMELDDWWLKILQEKSGINEIDWKKLIGK